MSSMISACQFGRSTRQECSSVLSCWQPRLISHFSISGNGWLYRGVSAGGVVIKLGIVYKS